MTEEFIAKYAQREAEAEEIPEPVKRRMVITQKKTEDVEQ